MSRGTADRNKAHSSIDLPLAAALAAMPLVLVVAYVPGHLLLPGITALAFIIAAFAAVVGRLTHANPRIANVTIWDFAGACVLIGAAAGILSEPHQVSQLFGIAVASP